VTLGNFGDIHSSKKESDNTLDWIHLSPIGYTRRSRRGIVCRC